MTIISYQFLVGSPSSSRTTSPSSSSSSTSSTQSGRDLRGSGGSGAILVIDNCKFNGTLCATDTLACRSNLTGGKTTSVSLGENKQLMLEGNASQAERLIRLNSRDWSIPTDLKTSPSSSDGHHGPNITHLKRPTE